jgi:uncharacterized protein YjbJ (UPF0337 family)
MNGTTEKMASGYSSSSESEDASFMNDFVILGQPDKEYPLPAAKPQSFLNSYIDVEKVRAQAAGYKDQVVGKLKTGLGSVLADDQLKVEGSLQIRKGIVDIECSKQECPTESSLNETPLVNPTVLSPSAASPSEYITPTVHLTDYINFSKWQGHLDQVIGKTKEGIGHVFGDRELEVEGILLARKGEEEVVGSMIPTSETPITAVDTTSMGEQQVDAEVKDQNDEMDVNHEDLTDKQATILSVVNEKYEKLKETTGQVIEKISAATDPLVDTIKESWNKSSSVETPQQKQQEIQCGENNQSNNANQ